MHEDKRIPVNKKQLIERQIKVIEAFCKKSPKIEWFINEEWDLLQDFICDNLKSEFSYATGISVMDAADSISLSQVENGMEKESDS